jgi:hypothetical protein
MAAVARRGRSVIAVRPQALRSRGATQVWLFLGAYLLYGMSRWIAIGDLPTATDHAHWIVAVERGAGVEVEGRVQDALAGSPLLWLLNHLYLAAQLVVVPATLVWLYRSAPRAYVALRDTVLATWLIALPVYALFPVAPPRLAGIGMVDTITSQSGIALNSKLTTAFYNQLAAVPSLHAGFALAVSVAIAATAGRWWVKLVCRAVGADDRARRRRDRQPLRVRHPRGLRGHGARLRGRPSAPAPGGEPPQRRHQLPAPAALEPGDRTAARGVGLRGLALKLPDVCSRIHHGDIRTIGPPPSQP